MATSQNNNNEAAADPSAIKRKLAWRMGVAGLMIVTTILFSTGCAVGWLRDNAEERMAKLRVSSRTDPLTGLLNRRGFQDEVEQCLADSRAGGPSFCLVVGDLDDFKLVNDRMGHLGGDMTLERVASIVSRTKRLDDVGARIGGEEFALALPAASGAVAMSIAERLRGAIEKDFATGPMPLTSSFGVACFPDHGHTLEALLGSADQALYAAKRAGKNRTLVYDDSLRTGLEVPDQLPQSWEAGERPDG